MRVLDSCRIGDMQIKNNACDDNELINFDVLLLSVLNILILKSHISR